ncbi:MAG: T9SS type A sorting domain-containing protein [Bacteroidota bacterium]
MKRITQVIKISLASVLFTLVSTHLHAQFIVGPGNAPCGATVSYSANSGQVNNPTYSWTVTFSSGGGTGGAGPSITVPLPNTRGTASVFLQITGTITVSTNNPQKPWETEEVPVNRFASFTTVIGDPNPSRPGIISGPNNVCGNNSTRTYSISAVSGASQYRWEVTSPYRIIHPTTGALVTSYTGAQTSIQVRFPSSGSVANGKVRVAAMTSGTCPGMSSFRELTVAFGPQSYPITGLTDIPKNSSATYQVSGIGLTNFSWSTPSVVTLLTSTNTDRVVVRGSTLGSGYITATYRSCNVTQSSTKRVYVTGTTGGGVGFFRNAPVEEETTISLAGIYPNPATEAVTVTSEFALEQVMVVNLMGQVVKTLDQVSGNTASIKVQDLEAGTYFVIALDSQGKQTHQLIVE